MSTGPLFEPFYGPSFDVIKWVNEALTPTNQSTTITDDTNISTLIAKLQVLSQVGSVRVAAILAAAAGRFPLPPARPPWRLPHRARANVTGHH